MNVRSRRLAATVVAGVLLLGLGVPAAAATEIPPTTSTGTVSFGDSLENGFGNWRLITDGRGAITADRGKTGSGMRLRSVSSGDRAYARYELSQGTNGIVATAWFRIMRADCDASAGWSKGNVPLFRLFDAAGKRIAGVFAVKTPCRGARQLYVQHSFDNYYPTKGRIALRAWNRIQFTVTVTTPGRSLVDVRLNGSRVYRTTVASNGLDPIAAVQLGNEHLGQSGDLVVDDVRLRPVAATAPAADVCTPGLVPSPTVIGGTTVLASSFEDRTLADWDVRLAGTGRVTVESGQAQDGACAARIRSDRGAISRAMLWAALPADSTDVAAEGWFMVASEGTARSNVPFFRITRGSTRSIDVYRQNADDSLWLGVREGTRVTRTKLGVTVPLGEWHQVALHVNATTGAISVWLDGTLRTKVDVTFSIGTSPFTRVIVGSDAYSQPYDLWVDGIVITTGMG